MAKRSRDKGNTFERKVAKEIVAAAGRLFKAKDCYRTPQSGGHRFAGKSDLRISPSLQAILPFCVECKHHKDVRTHHFFEFTAKMTSFHQQVLASAAKEELAPMLVVRGGDKQQYASMPIEAARAWAHGLEFDGSDMKPVLHYQAEGKHWIAIQWANFLKLLTLYGETLACEVEKTADK
jgi:hypothetical protein